MNYTKLTTAKQNDKQTKNRKGDFEYLARRISPKGWCNTSNDKRHRVGQICSEWFGTLKDC